MDTATKHLMSECVDPLFAIFLTSRHCGAQDWASECPDVKNIAYSGLTQSSNEANERLNGKREKELMHW